MLEGYTRRYALSLPSVRSAAPPTHAPSISLQLHYLAREYPDPSYPIHQKLHACFLGHVGKDRDKVEQGIKKAEFIKKGEGDFDFQCWLTRLTLCMTAELEALYFLRKYRAMKGRYYG